MYGTPDTVLPMHSSANVWKHHIRGSIYRVLAASRRPRATPSAAALGLQNERPRQRRRCSATIGLAEAEPAKHSHLMHRSWEHHLSLVLCFCSK